MLSVLLPFGNIETMYPTQVTNDTMTVLARVLEPVGHCFTPEVAQAIVALRADPAVQARLEDLADKSTQNTLSEDERIEYETYVHAIDFIAVLQSQARRILNHPGAN